MLLRFGAALHTTRLLLRIHLEYFLLSTIEKLANLHEICDVANKPIIRKSEHLFSQVKELFKIRNQWVHGKNKSLIDVEQDGEMGWVDTSGKDLGDFPYLKVPAGLNFNKATKIPINPFELQVNHGELCIQIVDKVETPITKGFQLPKDEIHSLDLYDETGNKIGEYPIDRVWGVYTPTEKNCPE